MKIEFFWATLLAFISFHFGTQFQFMFFLFCHNLFPFCYHWLLQDLWESTSVLWTKFNRFFATPSHWLWFGDLQKHEQHISYEIVMKSIVTWKCWMIISPFCLRLCTSALANLYTSVWGFWSLLGDRLLVIGDRILVIGDRHTNGILCQRAPMLFRLIVLKRAVMILIIDILRICCVREQLCYSSWLYWQWWYWSLVAAW